ncbi:bola-domain-containing protein [Backusella circina FSU 941]|nr:bola-domain-containing protein [Backusella circina FSU 941]
MLTRVFASQPIRQSVRVYSSSSHFLKDFVSTKEKGPVQVSIETKISQKLNPSILEAINESHLHSHHVAMKGVANKETHFRITSLMQRHRLIYGLLADEIAEGVHALTLRTKTQEEIGK